MENQASITSLMSAFSRAFHTENEACPVFSDTKARELMTDDEYNMIKGYILGGIDFFAPEKKGSFANDAEALRYLVNTHLAPTPLCRASYCESALKTAMQTGTRQYVILGAGLDTFAFREPKFVSKYKVFEVDHPLTQANKLVRIARAGWNTPENLTFVGVDFSKDDLKQKLLESGFDKDQKTFFSWLGVSYYLSIEEIGSMLKSLSEISAEGSTLLFDYADSGLFLADEKRVRNMIAMAKAGGEEMKSSFDYLSVDRLLGTYGFLVYEVLTPMDIQRMIIDSVGADIKAFEHINYIQAVLKGNK